MMWDGAQWTVDASDNPAWVKYDILTRPVLNNNLNVVRYDGYDPSSIDINAWKESADFNNTLCPDGKGGQEKRITFNGGFDYKTNVWAAVMRVSDIDRAAPVHNGLRLTLAIDKPSTPKQMFTVGNIERNSWKRNWLPTAERAAEITASFQNQEKDYERDEFSTFNNSIDTSIDASMELFGETRPSGVWRNINWRLNNNQYILDSAQLRVFTEALRSTLGDVVNIQHDVPAIGQGGRLVAATVNTLTLDREVTIEAGKTYQVMVTLTYPSVAEVAGNNYMCKSSHTASADNKPGTGANWQSFWVATAEVGVAWITGTEYYEPGAMLLKTVSNAPGTYTAINVTASFSKAPAKYDIYSFGEANKVVKPYKIVDIQPTMDFKCTLSLVEYNESIYNTDLEQPVLPTPDYSSLDTLPSVTDIKLDELLIRGKDCAGNDVINIYFTKPDS
ncbi:MAG: phage tail protein, partial [Patescibacteria group bacterium]